MNYLLQLVLILLLTKLGAHIAATFNLPSVIGELLVGILAGPAVFHILTYSTFIQYFAEIGVIILMFIAGLEGDLKLLFRYWKPALTVATLGVIFPTASAVLLCVGMFDFSLTTSIFLGLILSATSVSITVQVLKEMDYLNTREGAIILGAAVADDIICVVLLGISTSLFGTASAHNQSLVAMVLPKVLFFVVVIALAKWFVPLFLREFNKVNASENITTAAMVLCFGFSFLAVKLGMSDVLGAYIAGLAISETRFKAQLVAKVEPIGYAVFIPAFFVSIGLEITFKGMQNDLVFIGLLLVLAILGKQIGGAIGGKLFGLTWNEANIVGAGMVSRGEMALVVANVAVSAGLIDHNHYTAMIVVTVMATLIAPSMLKTFIQHGKRAVSHISLNKTSEAKS
ncbi:cation:proton antiporter [Lactiplantibacillus plantarum]|uniref:cation:proton antiporter n=1 Tax=Lactiplantibacillus plantarum TaxID=1590 RepID=UPI003BA18323